jgi:uncharacterized membrane protein YgcG
MALPKRRQGAFINFRLDPAARREVRLGVAFFDSPCGDISFDCLFGVQTKLVGRINDATELLAPRGEDPASANWPFLYSIKRESIIMTKLYVGNLSFSMTERDLHELFSQAGEVESARIITDRDTGRSRGFGFVEYRDPAAAESAIKQFNGYQVSGRELTVNEAKPQVPRSGGGGGGKGGWGRGSHRGGGGHRGGYDRY